MQAVRQPTFYIIQYYQPSAGITSLYEDWSGLANNFLFWQPQHTQRLFSLFPVYKLHDPALFVSCVIFLLTMLSSPNIFLDNYAVSPDHGFLPNGLPLQKLPHSYYHSWETLASQLPSLIKNGQIRSMIDSLPILTTSWLRSEPEWRRAYSILGFLTHAYIWGGEKPKDVRPAIIPSSFQI
jgi:hypothetical protein